MTEFPTFVKGRDPEKERSFLDDAERLVAQLRGISHQPGEFDLFRRKVNERLAIGAERYGEGAFMGRDNLTEVEEETPDVAAYSMLELERLDHLDPDVAYEIRAELVTAAAYAAIADLHVRMARQKVIAG